MKSALFSFVVVASLGCAAAGDASEATIASEAASFACTRAAQARTADASLIDAFLEGPHKDPARVAALLDAIDDGGGTPLEDRRTERVVFVATGEGSWAVTTSLVGFDPTRGTRLSRVAGTPLWVGEIRAPRGKSFEYKLLHDGRWVEDPRAKNVVWDGIDRHGVGEFNAVGRPSSLPMDRGRLVSMGPLHATALGNDRPVYVYLPPRYDDGSCRKLPSVVFHDGNESLTRADFAGAADALYRSQPELSALLVFAALPSQSVRMEEYTFGPGSKGALYVDFLANDLWPELRRSYRVCTAPRARGISGASLGGLISSFAAFEKPAVWGWVGAQSASLFWQNDAMIRRAAASPRIDVRFYLDSGCPDDNCAVTDEMHEVLRRKGYDVVRVKEDGAEHDWRYWRGRLGGLLSHFRADQTACE